MPVVRQKFHLPHRPKLWSHFSGGDEEYYIAATPPSHLSFEDQLKHINSTYEEAQKSLGLGGKVEVKEERDKLLFWVRVRR
ncbi:MAG: hypothetical protein WBX25_17530 [Rhodomicrobium sp.]